MVIVVLIVLFWYLTLKEVMSEQILNGSCGVNLLKTKRICYILELSPYRAVNTLPFCYKNIL
jgi:hypothetical protein